MVSLETKPICYSVFSLAFPNSTTKTCSSLRSTTSLQLPRSRIVPHVKALCCVFCHPLLQYRESVFWVLVLPHWLHSMLFFPYVTVSFWTLLNLEALKFVPLFSDLMHDTWPGMSCTKGMVKLTISITTINTTVYPCVQGKKLAVTLDSSFLSIICQFTSKSYSLCLWFIQDLPTHLPSHISTILIQATRSLLSL